MYTCSCKFFLTIDIEAILIHRKLIKRRKNYIFYANFYSVSYYVHDSECESGWIQSPSKSIDLIYDLVISLPFNLKKNIYILN